MLTLTSLLLTHALAGLSLAPASGPAATCAAFPTALEQLVPADASWVLGLDIDAFVATRAGHAMLPALRADLEIAEALELAEDCGLSLERSYQILVARAPGDGRLAVLQSRGLGEEGTLACLADELRARQGNAEPWVRVAGPCGAILDTALGDRVWVINEFTLVWARGTFIEAVGDRLEGRSPLAVPPALAGELSRARADADAQLWIAARLDDEERRALPGAWAQEVQTLSASLRFSAGFEALLVLSTQDIAATALLRDLLLASVLALADRLDSYGVEHELREHAGLDIIDGLVALRLSLTPSEIQAIRKRVGERVRGRGLL